jgi:putative membrane protein
MATAWYGNQSEWDGTEFMEKAYPHYKVPIDPIERQYLLGQVSLMTWAFVRSMKRHLSPPQEDENDFISEIKSRLAPEQADALIGATHRPNRALYDLSVAIEKVSYHYAPS